MLLIGTLFDGGGETSYIELCNSVGMHGFSSTTNKKYFRHWHHAAEELWKTSQKRCLAEMERAGRSQDLVLLFDGSWLHRGYASQHGTSALIDVVTGCILFLKHESKDKSRFGREPHKISSA